MAVTVDDVKRDSTPQDYLTLTLGDDANAGRAIEKALIWAKGKILSTGNPFDEDNEVVKQIVVTRALYELYFFVGYPEKARTKEEDAADLIESYFGSIKTKADKTAETGPAGGAVSVPELPDYGR
ncbi:MAG: hypothetical protein LBC31_08760 [Treponema sp.]|jgi:hypothetical protein|nr:hypothetical protein [Treponema sp.]